MPEQLTALWHTLNNCQVCSHPVSQRKPSKGYPRISVDRAASQFFLTNYDVRELGIECFQTQPITIPRRMITDFEPSLHGGHGALCFHNLYRRFRYLQVQVLIGDSSSPKSSLLACKGIIFRDSFSLLQLYNEPHVPCENGLLGGRPWEEGDPFRGKKIPLCKATVI